MPINKPLAKKLIEKYGHDRGMDIYFSLEREGKESFKKGLKTAISKGHILKKFPRKKKKK
jgi:hypothetical protein